MRRWVAKVDMPPGFIEPVFRVLAHTDFEPIQTVCILMADEMKVYTKYEYCKKTDTTLDPAKYVQVMFMKCLFQSLKQPIRYNYDETITKELLFETIHKVHAAGFRVRVIDNDLGKRNISLWNELGVSYEKPYFTNPVDGKIVYCYADTPHLMKLVRNWILDGILVIDGVAIDDAPLWEMLKMAEKNQLKTCHKLNREQLTVAGPARQKVSPATKLLSHTNAMAMNRLGEQGLFQCPYWKECADFIKTV